MPRCMACERELEPGVDYPREKVKVVGIEVGPETPILCWDPIECVERANEKARKEGYTLG